MADEPAGGELDLSDADHVAVVHEHVGRHGNPLGVVPAGVGAGAGGGHDLRERLPVVAVPVGGDDGRDAVVTDHAQQRPGVVRRVDQQLLVGGPAAQQVRVVLHGADRDLGDHQVLEFVHVGRPPTVTRPLYVMSVSLAPEPAPDRAHRGGSFEVPALHRQGAAVPASGEPAEQVGGRPLHRDRAAVRPAPVVQVRPSVDDKVVAGTSA